MLILNGLGEIVTPTFELNIFQSGFEHLCLAVDEAVTRTGVQVVLDEAEAMWLRACCLAATESISFSKDD